MLPSAVRVRAGCQPWPSHGLRTSHADRWVYVRRSVEPYDGPVTARTALDGLPFDAGSVGAWPEDVHRGWQQQGRRPYPPQFSQSSVSRSVNSRDAGIAVSTGSPATPTSTPWPTRRELIGEVFDYIEAICNPTRRPPTLGYLSPAHPELRAQIPRQSPSKTTRPNQPCLPHAGTPVPGRRRAICAHGRVKRGFSRRQQAPGPRPRPSRRSASIADAGGAAHEELHGVAGLHFGAGGRLALDHSSVLRVVGHE